MSPRRRLGRLVERLGRGDGDHDSAVSTTGFTIARSRRTSSRRVIAARDLDAGAADLAVAHGGVQVAGGEQRARARRPADTQRRPRRSAACPCCRRARPAMPRHRRARRARRR